MFKFHKQIIFKLSCKNVYILILAYVYPWNTKQKQVKCGWLTWRIHVPTQYVTNEHRLYVIYFSSKGQTNKMLKCVLFWVHVYEPHHQNPFNNNMYVVYWNRRSVLQKFISSWMKNFTRYWKHVCWRYNAYEVSNRIITTNIYWRNLPSSFDYNIIISYTLLRFTLNLKYKKTFI